MTETPDLQMQLAKASADLASANERIAQLEKERNELQTKQMITGSQIIDAQKLRLSDPTKTKAELAKAVGVEHQLLASVLQGVDAIVTDATKGTYTETQMRAVVEENEAVKAELASLKSQAVVPSDTAPIQPEV